jgi:hypothetical protein
MENRQQRCSRRKFLASAAAFTLAGGVSAPAAEPQGDLPLSRTRPAKPSNQGRKPLAVLTTVYRPLSHAYHIAGRFLHGYARGGKLHVPKHYVHSLYVDQTPDNDLSDFVARKFGVRVARRTSSVSMARGIQDVLTEGGKLAVEGVLLIGEHGNYPRNDAGQILYPRLEMMEQIANVFRKTGQSVPVFNDKHLSFTFDRAKKMLAWSRELKFPMMAGSSLPVVWRTPELELPLESPIEDALVAAYDPIEVYGFHALETLHVMLERRKGGESGVKAVTCLSGNDVWKAGDSGRWSWDLLEAALSRSETVNPGDIRDNVGGMVVYNYKQTPPLAFLIEYRDGTRGTVLQLNGHVLDFTFAAKLRGESKPASCLFHLPPPPGARFFDAQVANLEKFFQTSKAPYPVERTLLTTGILDAAMRSHQRRGARIETPELLDVRYTAPTDSGFLRGTIADF